MIMVENQKMMGRLLMETNGYPLWYKRTLKFFCVIDDDNWIKKNVFHTKCISHGRVWMVIINSGSFENVVSLDMVQKLKLETVPYHNLYQLRWL